jgi:ABC-type glycerol-3-phosphate transport system substrate-binding protein
MSHNPEMMGLLNTVLSEFQVETGYDYGLREIDYDSGWSEFVRTAIYGLGLDLSEIGTTWVNDFAGMQVLRPYSLPELRPFASQKDFPPAMWRSVCDSEGGIWAAPWMTDISLVYYRRDLLQKAGVDEAKAFSSPAEFDHTLYSLQRSGVGSPLVLPTRRSHITIHNIAMWLWACKTDFLTPSGKQVILNEPSGRAALRSYFSLYHYLSPSARRLNNRNSDNLFATGGAAVTIAGPWLLPYLIPEVRENLGLAAPLGQSYLGGSAIVIWKSSERPQEALRCAETLLSKGVQMLLPQKAGMLPARLDVLESFPLAVQDDASRQVIIQALKGGRTLPSLPIWGLVEDRLVTTFERFWEDLLSDPSPQIDRLMDEHLVPDFQRLGIVMSNY